MSKHYITCRKCKTENVNTDYCIQCGEIINIALERQLEQQRIQKERIQKELDTEPTKWDVFIQKIRTHSNPIVRLIYIIIYSIWIVVATIAAGIAYIIGMIAA